MKSSIFELERRFYRIETKAKDFLTFCITQKLPDSWSNSALDKSIVTSAEAVYKDSKTKNNMFGPEEEPADVLPSQQSRSNWSLVRCHVDGQGKPPCHQYNSNLQVVVMSFLKQANSVMNKRMEILIKTLVPLQLFFYPACLLHVYCFSNTSYIVHI